MHPRTRSFAPQWGTRYGVMTSQARGSRPGPGGALVVSPLPVGQGGEPFNGMDPSNPVSWVRPWNPQPGMIAYLNFDGAKAQGDTPTGTRRGPQSNIRQRRHSQRTGRG